MKRPVFIIFLTMTFFFLSCNQEKMNYPLTKKTDTADNYFGTVVPDPYRWLEDDHSEETKEWVVAQNEVTFGYLDAIPFRDKIRDRLEELWNYPRMGTPFREGEHYFYSYNDGLQNQNVIYIKNDLEDKGEVFLDPNKFSEDGTIALTTFSVSNDGKYAGYGISKGGSDWNEFFIKEIETGDLLEDHLKWIKFSGMSWYKDGFFYNRFDEPSGEDALKGQNLNAKLCYHKAGTSQDEDVVVFESKENPAWSFRGSVTEDEKYLIISIVESTTGNALYIKDLGNPDAEIIKVVDNFDNDNYFIGSDRDKLFFLTNYGAPMYRLVRIDLENPERENWKVVLPERDKMVLESVIFAGGKMIAKYLKDARNVLEVFTKNGEKVNEIELPGIGTVNSLSAKDKYDKVFYSFTSFQIPSEIYQYDISNNKNEQYFRPELNFDPDNYITKQIFYESKDGTKIPMFIVHKKDLETDGKRPTLLYGYGGFNISKTPEFSLRNLIWLENNGVFALPNIRGGGEYGEEWHKAGTLLRKQNVFDDFIAAGEYLVENNYTSPERLAVYGGSNGGLLVGAVVNQRPDLFAVGVPAVGVMDMLRFHKFTIGHYWVADYGSSENEEQFHYLYKYSPLHNIDEDIDYPAVIVTTADHDDRVVPAHSFKYIATLQEKYKGENPVLIRIETDAGHGAGKPVSKMLDEYADIWSFAFYNMDFKPVY